ncbi:hypothetical protein GCM10010149_26570 [Nonomuraea roseoviolacea subsp. roseoviolacea]
MITPSGGAGARRSHADTLREDSMSTTRSSAPEARETPETPDPTVHDPRQRRAILAGVCVALMAVIASPGLSSHGPSPGEARPVDDAHTRREFVGSVARP